MTNPFQSMLDAQREHFLTDATTSYERRITQFDRMERMLTDNKDALCAALQGHREEPERVFLRED